MMTAVLSALLVGLAAGSGVGQVSNSAPVGTMLVHADIAPVIGLPGDTIRARLFFSTDSQQTWTERPMLRMAEPGYDSTWQAAIAVPTGPGRLWYYVNADEGGGFATQSPVNTADAWPVTGNLLARVAVDPVGDALEPDGPWVDLTGARVGRSDTMFYAELTNNHDSWPTSGFNKRYVYSLGFSNPEAASDSWVFAPVYASAWPVMETGLFAINRYTGATPERIGDIEAVAAGNRLLMRCRIADIASDPRFGPWPNSQGWLRTAATTQTITVFPQRVVTNDTTVPGQFHALATGRPVLGSNREFTLAQPRVTPDTGAPGTEFSFSVSYTDPDTNPPTLRLVTVGSDSFRLAPDNRRYWRGTTFRARRGGFAPGPHEAVFRFSDGAADTTARVWFHVSDSVGIAEPGTPADGGPARPRPGVVSRVLDLHQGTGPFALHDAAGRKVMDLRPGRNDLDRLAPGVYFVLLPGPGRRTGHRFVLVP